MMRDKNLLKNTLWYGIIPKITIIINVFLLPITTPYLTRADYGLIGVINSYSALFLCICTLGLHMHLPNSYFEYKAKYRLVWRRIFGLVLFSCFIFSIIQIVCLLVVLPNTYPYSRILVILLSIIPIFLYSNQLIANNYFVLIERPKPLVTRNLFAGLIGICITFICITYFQLGYLSWLISSAVTSILLFILFLKPIYLKEQIYPVLTPFNQRTRSFLLISLPIIPHAAGHLLLSSSDRIIMSLFNISLDDIGLYTNGYQMGEYISFVIIGIFTALNPTLQRAFRSDNKKQLRYFFWLTQSVVFTLIILFSLWMHIIYQFLIRNESLQAASNIAVVVVFSFMYFPIYIYMALPVFIEKKTNNILWLVFVPGVLNILLNIIFIPYFGYKCVAYITLIAYWTIPLICFWHPFYRKAIKNMLGAQFLKELCFLFLLWIMSFYCIIKFMQNLPFIILIFVSILIFLAFIFYYKALRKKNL